MVNEHYGLEEDRVWIKESYNLVVSKLPKAVRVKISIKTIMTHFMDEGNKGQIILYRQKMDRLVWRVQLQGE